MNFEATSHERNPLVLIKMKSAFSSQSYLNDQRRIIQEAESQLWQLFQITSPYPMIGLISLLYKNVNVDLSTLFLTHFSIFNRLEAFLYILTIRFLHDILLCKVKPKWVWDSMSLTTKVSRCSDAQISELELKAMYCKADNLDFYIGCKTYRNTSGLRLSGSYLNTHVM